MASTRNPPPPSSGIISNVLGYWSREYDKFVATATGAPLPDDETDDVDNNVSPKLSSQPSSVSSPNQKRIGVKRAAETSPDEQATSRPRREPLHTHIPEPTSNAPSTSFTLWDTYSSIQEQSVILRGATASSRPPNAFTGRRQRRMSVTMPGSLFPRSESLEPDEGTPGPAPDNSTRVHFAATPAELSRRYQTSGGDEAGPSRLPIPFPQLHLEVEGAPPEQGSPLGRKRVASTKAAAGQTNPEVAAEGSLSISPDNSVSPPATHTVSVSPERSLSCAGSPAHSTEFSPQRLSAHTQLDKGKGKAIDNSLFDVDAETSGVIRFRGKQKELDDALEEYRRNEQHREQVGSISNENDPHHGDQLKIRMLEEEVRSLRAELAKRSSTAPITDALIATPAPPAPPPPPLSSFSTPMPIRDLNAGTDSILTAVRASLRHAGTPAEAPINVPGIGAGARAKRTGQPTVKISNDKMASFLLEVKSAKLRPVGESSFVEPAGRTHSRNQGALKRRATVEDLRRRGSSEDSRSRSQTQRSVADEVNLSFNHLLPKPSGWAIADRTNITLDHMSAPPPPHMSKHVVAKAPIQSSSKNYSHHTPDINSAHPIMTEEASKVGLSIMNERANLTLDCIPPVRSRQAANADQANMTVDHASAGAKRKRAPNFENEEDGARRRNFQDLRPLPAKPGSKAVHKPARVVLPLAPATNPVARSIPRVAATRQYRMPPQIMPPSTWATANSTTDPTPSLTSDHGASPDDDHPSELSLSTPPAVEKPAPHLDLLKLVGHSGNNGKSLPMQSTVPRQPRGKRLSGPNQAFVARPAQSPLMGTPRRPLPPSRRSISAASAGSVRTPEDVGSNERYQLKRPEPNTGKISQPSQRVYRQPSPLQSLGLELDVFADAGEHISFTRRPPTPPRPKSRGTLADEIMRASSSSFEDGHEFDVELEDLDLDSGILVGTGTRSKKRGFLAHGGAGGPAVFMGKGYIDGAMDSEEEEAERLRAIAKPAPSRKGKARAIAR